MTVLEKKQMNAGVELLLKRMETHPEEFLVEGMHITSKWGHLIAEYLESLEPEDRDVLKQGLNKLKQQRFTEKVLEGLVDPKSSRENPEISPYLKNIASGGQTQGQSWADIQLQKAEYQAAQQAQAIQLQHMLAHKEYLTKQTQQTIFGRLKNYLHNESN